MSPLASLLETLSILPDAVLVVDGSGHIVACNDDVEALFGYTPDDLTGSPLSILIPPESRAAHPGHMASFTATGGHRLMDGRPVLSGIARSGIRVPISIGISSLEDDGERYFLAVIRDARSFEDTLEMALTVAETDALTGLGNRRRLDELLVSSVNGRKRKYAILYLDLDGFKPFNDRYGHEVGDRVLSIVARRLQNAVRSGDHCIRVGGDEFVVLLKGISDRQALAGIADKIHSRITLPLNIDGVRGSVGVSMGGVLAAEADIDPSLLIKQADDAMYRAKQAGSVFCLHGDDVLPEAASA